MQQNSQVRLRQTTKPVTNSTYFFTLDDAIYIPLVSSRKTLQKERTKTQTQRHQCVRGCAYVCVCLSLSPTQPQNKTFQLTQKTTTTTDFQNKNPQSIKKSKFLAIEIPQTKGREGGKATTTVTLLLHYVHLHGNANCGHLFSIRDIGEPKVLRKWPKKRHTENTVLIRCCTKPQPCTEKSMQCSRLCSFRLSQSSLPRARGFFSCRLCAWSLCDRRFYPRLGLALFRT